jgi:hypothetical protein
MKKVKVKVTWELELPFNDNDEVYKFDAKGLAIQTVFDDLVNYAICGHLQDASHWLSKSKGDEKSTEYRIYKHHDFWADILREAEKNGKVKYEVELPKEPTKMYWVNDDGKHCPICVVEMGGCHLGSFCSKEKGGCGKWCDGYADLTKEEAEKFKDIILR